MGLEKEFLGRTSHTLLQSGTWLVCLSLVCSYPGIPTKPCWEKRKKRSIFSSWEMEVGETRVEEKSLVVAVVTTRKESSGICCSFQD